MNFASKIEGSQISGKKPVGHLIKTHSDKFFLQQSGKKKTDKDKGKKKKSKKGKKAGGEGGRQEDYQLLCMFGLCGGRGGGSQVELSQRKVTQRSEICQKSKGYLSKNAAVVLFFSSKIIVLILNPT